MNQQRSRRFRASKETQEKIEEVARIRSELQVKGAYLPPERPKEAHFDSNCITPGTPFMDRLSKCLHYYIHDRFVLFRNFLLLGAGLVLGSIASIVNWKY